MKRLHQPSFIQVMPFLAVAVVAVYSCACAQVRKTSYKEGDITVDVESKVPWGGLLGQSETAVDVGYKDKNVEWHIKVGDAARAADNRAQAEVAKEAVDVVGPMVMEALRLYAKGGLPI